MFLCPYRETQIDKMHWMKLELSLFCIFAKTAVSVLVVDLTGQVEQVEQKKKIMHVDLTCKHSPGDSDVKSRNMERTV